MKRNCAAWLVPVEKKKAAFATICTAQWIHPVRSCSTKSGKAAKRIPSTPILLISSAGTPARTHYSLHATPPFGSRWYRISTGGTLKSFLLALATEPERMPVPLQLAFMAMAVMLPLFGWFRSWRSRREWEAKTAREKRKPYRPSAAERLEISLSTSGSMFCWAVAVSDWRFRALFGVVGLFGIVALLYRRRSETEQPPTFDSASVLHVEPQLDATLHLKS